MLVTCQICKKKIDRTTAYKITKNGINKYYCNQEEYLDYISKSENRKLAIEKTFEILGQDFTNTQMMKELIALDKVYGYKAIYDYLCENEKWITNTMHNKEFNSQYAMARYLAAILKNNLNEFVKKKKPQINNDIIKKEVNEIPEMTFSRKKKRKSFAEIEAEEGESL